MRCYETWEYGRMQKENRSVCGREGKREMAIRGMSEKPRLEWYITSRVARHNGERERERESFMKQL